MFIDQVSPSPRGICEDFLARRLWDKAFELLSAIISEALGPQTNNLFAAGLPFSGYGVVCLSIVLYPQPSLWCEP